MVDLFYLVLNKAQKFSSGASAPCSAIPAATYQRQQSYELAVNIVNALLAANLECCACNSHYLQVTRQLGPVQQPKQDPPAAPTPALTTQHTSPSRDMAMNTDMDMGGLEELVMNPDVMSNPSADPFSASHASYLQPHTTDASVPDQRHGYPQQQQRTWTRGAAPATGNAGSTTATAVQPQRQPSEPIFYNGQWFMPAPPGFTPPSGFSPPAQQQQSYNGVSQQVQGPHTPQALPQQHSRQQHLPQGAPHYQQHHEPQLQLQQQQQQQSFQQVPQQQQASNLHARTPQNPHMPSGQFAAASGQFSSAPGLTPANTASKDQVWSPTSAYQFESPTFRNGAAQQLSPGESGRTWSPVASDVTRLTLPQTEAAPSQQKVCSAFSMKLPLRQHETLSHTSHFFSLKLLCRWILISGYISGANAITLLVIGNAALAGDTFPLCLNMLIGP